MGERRGGFVRGGGRKGLLDDGVGAMVVGGIFWGGVEGRAWRRVRVARMENML